MPESNVTLNLGSGGSKVATIDDGTAHHQKTVEEFMVGTTPTNVSSANPLPVVQTGTPTLPTGAATLAEQQTQTTHQSAIAASASVLDDWDETDRAKVNPIVGQAGIEGGAGASTAKTVRVAPASDVVAPVSSTQLPAALAAGGGIKVEGVAGGVAQPVSNAAATQADGHSASIGATADADTALTVIGRLKKLLTQLPAALAANGGLKVEGVAGGVAQPISAASLPLPSGAATNAELTADFTALGTLLTDGSQATGVVDAVAGSNPLEVTTRKSARVEGAIAHDVADAGDPIKVGGRARSTLDNVVADEDRVDSMHDLDGALIVRDGCPLGDVLSERVTNTDGADTACTGDFAADANFKHVVEQIVVYNDSVTNGFVDLKNGTGGTIRITVPLPSKGGAVIALKKPIIIPVNTALAYDVSAALTTVYLTFIGYKTKV